MNAITPNGIEEGSTEPLAYSVEDAARVSNTSRTELYEALRLRQLRGKKRGRRTLILPTDLREYLRNLPDYAAGEAVHND